MKQNSRKQKPIPPCEPWQVGVYSRKLKLDILLPYPFLLLCKLWEIEPETIITDFLDNLAHASWKREGRDSAKQKLAEYILLSGYSKEHYSEEATLQMIRELDALGLLFPQNGTDKTLDSYVAFRDNFYKYWFDKWYYKSRRKEP